MARKPKSELRRGWSTGACATAATKAAYQALLTGEFPDPVTITLPKGERPAFALACAERARAERGVDYALAGVVKDAGDDPDVTHGALILARVTALASGSGVVFRAGIGVGTVTKPGLPIAPGEPAINPVPRQLMQGVVAELAAQHGAAGAVEIEISIPGGLELARKTWNPRLGIVGGLSILGTTGVVIPYSCSAWIHSIQRGVDVARAAGLTQVAACTGATSEKAVQALYNLPDHALLDMGDFVGGTLKYLRRHPIPRLILGGGFGKVSKLARGQLDLHSGRSQVDLCWLAERAHALGADPALSRAIESANNANHALLLAQAAGVALADAVATQACAVAHATLRNTMAVEVLIIDSKGCVVGHGGGWSC